MKRLFDIVGAAVLLLVFSPLMLCIALLVRIKLGKPVFFLQRRPGYRQQAFTLIKFRTMRSVREGEDSTSGDEDRLGRFGSLLRASSLDELPELWNVLVGDMSLVGPRPLLMEYLPLYSKEQMRRHELRPGITGWAQVNGRNAIDWDERFKLDVWYVDNRTFWLDIKILLLTLVKIISTEGVNSRNHVTMEKFKGDLQ